MDHSTAVNAISSLISIAFLLVIFCLWTDNEFIQRFSVKITRYWMKNDYSPEELEIPKKGGMQ